MTKRQRYLKALRNEKVDSLVWAPNFDYWLTVNRADGTVPAKYADMNRNDIVRAIDGYIWNRAEALRYVYDESVRETDRDVDGSRIHEFHTPIGSIQEVYCQTESGHSSKFLAEHFIKNSTDIPVMKYVVEATHYEPNYEPTLKALAETGDDGVVLNSYFCVPFIQFCKTDVGFINGFYLWADYRKEVDLLINSCFEKYLEGYRVLAEGPADIVATCDNMDGMTVPPDIFKEYAVPFYQEAGKIISSKGKIFEGHWCGRTQNLLPLVPGCGLDVVEAIVTEPMADISLCDALGRLKGQVVFQGGLPAVLVCEEGGSREEFERYVNDVIIPQKGRKGFILGMSDNVPPNADFSRVENVAEMIR